MFDRNQLQEQLISQGVVFFSVLHFPLPFIKEIPLSIFPKGNIPEKMHRTNLDDVQRMNGTIIVYNLLDLLIWKLRSVERSSPQPIWLHLLNLLLG